MTKHYNRKSQKSKRRKLRKEQTYYEKIVWIYLRNREMLGYKFRRQYSIDNHIIDFYCPKLKLAVEIDGDIHDKPEQIKYDIKRQKYLEEFGIEFVRIKNEELDSNPNKTFKKIEDIILFLIKNNINNR
jgi:very-short-patch-repair endonuclease